MFKQITSRLLAKTAMPFVCWWVTKHERTILREGVSLNAEQSADARRVGIVNPERVRVLVVESVPPWLPSPLQKVTARLGIGPSRTAGMALGYGIFVRSDFQNDRALLLHELVHTAQYERLGVRAFLEQYVAECFNEGYPFGALEEEARMTARELSA